MHNEESASQKGRSLFTRDLVLLFFAFFTFVAANNALIPTLPIYLAKIGSNERQIGILVGTIGLAALVSRFLVGGVLTRYSEKKVMLIGALLLAFTFPAIIAFSHFWPLLVVRVVQGIAFACFHTAALAYVVRVIPPARMGQGIAYFMLAPNFAIALVAPSGMLLINQYGFVIFFLSCTGLCALSLFLSWAVKAPRTIVTPKQQNAPSRNAFLPEWKVVVPAIANFLQMFVYGGLTAFIPLYALERGIANPGHFFTANAAVMIAGRLFGGRILDSCNKEKLILTLICIGMVSLIVLSFSKNLPMLILVGLLWGTGASFFMPACMSYAFEYAGSSGAPAVGTYQAFMDMGIALGPVAMGLILPATGYPAMWLCLALVGLINLCYFQFYVRRRGSAASPTSVSKLQR
jgi:predicted MFS family arabinose efflux permease